MEKEQIIKEYMSELGKKSWKKNKRSKKYMSELGKKGARIKAQKKLEKLLT